MPAAWVQKECPGDVVLLLPWSPEVTLADCAAWAEAIVVACEALGWTEQPVYNAALFLARALATRSPKTGHRSLVNLRKVVIMEALEGQVSIARAWSAIVAVRTLADEAARRQASHG